MHRVKTHQLRNGITLYTCASGLIRKVRAQNVIVYCHGLFEAKRPSLEAEKKFIVPPGVSLYFYCPHGVVMVSEAHEALYGKIEPIEVYTGGSEVVDYTLTPLDEEDLFYSDEFLTHKIRRHRSDLRKKNPTWLFDVLMPRTTTSLEALLLQMRLQNHFYPRVHCLFCRAPVWYYSVPESEWIIHRPAEHFPDNVFNGNLGRWRIIEDSDLD